MGFESNWANTADVVRNHYGPRDVKDQFGGQTSSSGLEKTVEWTFTYDDLPAASNGSMEYALPAGALIQSADIEIITAFNGTTPAITVGNAGVADAYITAANITETSAGWYAGTGAEVGVAVASGGEQLVVANSAGDSTQGKARVVIKYIQGDS